MDLTPFDIKYAFKDELFYMQVVPCCKEENVIFYDLWVNDEFDFTITKTADEWKIALVNADKLVEPEMVKIIGEQIDKHYSGVQTAEKTGADS